MLSEIQLQIGAGIAAFGVLPLLPAILDWDWFFNLPKLKQSFIGILGRQAQRILYGAIGAACVILGLLVATGLIPLV